MTILSAKKLTKSFKSPSKLTLFEDVTIEIAPGESVAITGPSGVGKSTLLHILGTLEKPDTGTLEIVGIDALHSSNHKLRNTAIGFVFQGSHLLDDLSVIDNVLMPARITGKITSEHKKRAVKLLKDVGLPTHANHLCKLLSGGEKQRVAIARALMNDPDLLLADEPTGNLDEESSLAIQKLLLDTGKALILVTHDATLAAACNRILHLHHRALTTI
ncbi:MAG: ABC transporter ATP-binding protein [Simkaniaceae bacterium]|nr:ABC transporter ATP-binding protein [Simkaniaceae bacterium]